MVRCYPQKIHKMVSSEQQTVDKWMFAVVKYLYAENKRKQVFMHLQGMQ